MPAQITLSHEQLVTLADQGYPVVLIEMPGILGDDRPVEAWVVDEESANSTNHRTLVVSSEGEILADHVDKD